MNAPLILLAASGLAREALEAARAQVRYDVVGFLDDDANRWGELLDGVKVLGGMARILDHPDAHVLACAGSGAARQRILSSVPFTGDRLATVIHPSVAVPASCTVGAGSILLAGSVLTAQVTVGRHVVVMPNVTLTHDDAIADFATLGAGVTLGGSVQIGERSYLGMAVSVRERCTVGADTIIGMGSVVLSDVPDGETWYGVPARRAGSRS
jgi:sugar O-acyltransferase (sialic acid O-acetyltransferase NeuD family)